MVVTSCHQQEGRQQPLQGQREDRRREAHRLIKATRPIVIVDEPQSVDGGLSGAGKTALDAMHPLCTLRYSATHVDKHHMVYRLDAVDAYEQRLVKQIEVASATVEDAHNKPSCGWCRSAIGAVASRRGSSWTCRPPAV